MTNAYSAFIPEIWSQKLNNLLEKDCVMLQCVNRNWEGEIKNQGDKVKIITPADVTISTLSTENITYSELEPTSQELVIDQKKFFAFKINDVAQVQANSDIMEAHLKNARKAIEEVQDAYLLAQHANVAATNIVGTDEAPVELDKSTVYANFVKLALCLKNSDAVTNGVRPWVVINPTVESYLLQSPEFIGANNVADETLRTGAIGRIAGMDVLVSTNLTAVSDIILFSILTFSGLACFAEIVAPRWDDFCPDGLENAEYKEIQWFWPEGSKSTQEIYNYWANRRKEFNTALRQCNAMDNVYKEKCYDGLRRRQKFFNDQYKRDIQLQQVTRQDWRDLHEKGSSPYMINIFQR